MEQYIRSDFNNSKMGGLTEIKTELTKCQSLYGHKQYNALKRKNDIGYKNYLSYPHGHDKLVVLILFNYLNGGLNK